MAAKMSVAATIDRTKVYAETIGILPKAPPLRCLYCGAGVSFVPQHTREIGGKVFGVQGYFRLLPKTSHDERCTFNIQGKLDTIARRSLGVLQALEEGQYRFRLLAHKEMRDLSLHSSRINLSRRYDQREAHSASASIAEHLLLSAYLNTAKRVLQLHARCQADNSLRHVIELVFNGLSISWDEFYYEPERYLAAYRWLGRKYASFPIAIAGRVSKIEAIKTRGRLLHVVKLMPSTPEKYVRDSTVAELVGASVWCSQESWLQPLQQDDMVLIFGYWAQASAHTLTRVARSDKAAFRKYLERRMTMWLHSRSQIIRL